MFPWKLRLPPTAAALSPGLARGPVRKQAGSHYRVFTITNIHSEIWLECICVLKGIEVLQRARRKVKLTIKPKTKQRWQMKKNPHWGFSFSRLISTKITKESERPCWRAAGAGAAVLGGGRRAGAPAVSWGLWVQNGCSAAELSAPKGRPAVPAVEWLQCRLHWLLNSFHKFLLIADPPAVNQFYGASQLGNTAFAARAVGMGWCPFVAQTWGQRSCCGHSRSGP